MFFLVMRICRIYSLSNLQICHTAVLTIGIRLYITSLVLIYIYKRLISRVSPLEFDQENEFSLLAMTCADHQGPVWTMVGNQWWWQGAEGVKEGGDWGVRGSGKPLCGGAWVVREDTASQA
uniref:Uncharacterized protein n=1 Tax=Pipistrellus kuhlii TaxID=59472 RepID=A0A7J8A8M0_PIPKU|nr:hypothetical protein mPipKuh1_008955 [Pipistrellus kuhlii]